MSTRATGAAWEDIAERYLRGRGFEIVTKNWTVPGWELDIVVQKGNVTVFVEVKLRKSVSKWHARESLSPLKKKRFLRSWMLYAVRYGIPEESMRFDFVAIQKSPTNYRIEHYCNIEI